MQTCLRKKPKRKKEKKANNPLQKNHPSVKAFFLFFILSMSSFMMEIWKYIPNFL